ncbi:hypothetical protein ENE68_23995 (plasmid) [Escherichia coli]|uniref:TorD/DmsD family molecular chaperone n=1 Tax=Escherichia coli TaxID=562 RepID=UPI000FD718D8|nr:molecular chaperone TorD family protein [Escherichia coli]AZW02489.1 hypothetical protein ENE68_23995 [Escherichia coli]
MSHRIETEAITERELSLVSLSLLYHFFCFEPQKALINNMLNSDILNLWHSKWDMDIHETNTFLQNQDALERLQADHLALFVGIGMPKAVPWGSVYLTEENLLLQRSTHALTAFLKSHRIILCTDEQQISDHIGLCLSVLALLLNNGEIIRKKPPSAQYANFYAIIYCHGVAVFANCSPPMLKRLYMHY